MKYIYIREDSVEKIEKKNTLQLESVWKTIT